MRTFLAEQDLKLLRVEEFVRSGDIPITGVPGVAVVLSVVGTLLFGTMIPATQALMVQVTDSSSLDSPRPAPTTAAAVMLP